MDVRSHVFRDKSKPDVTKVDRRFAVLLGEAISNVVRDGGGQKQWARHLKKHWDLDCLHYFPEVPVQTVLYLPTDSFLRNTVPVSCDSE
jgi:hypothetical protein